MEKFSTARTAQILDISTETLKRWYKWYEDEKWEKPLGLKLPTPERDNRNTMFFTMQQVQELIVFRDRLNSDLRGCMAEFNAYYQWGKRGKQIQENKKRKEEHNE